ncbi:MAG TPA: hypothetical protein VGC42_27340 [Kofleriaceae bacterium]
MSRSKAHTVSGDADQALGLLVAARAAGFEIAHVTVGNCRIELRTSPAALAPQDESPQRDPREMIYQQYGGELYRRAVSGASSTSTNTPAVPGADLQPAIEVDG